MRAKAIVICYMVISNDALVVPVINSHQCRTGDGGGPRQTYQVLLIFDIHHVTERTTKSTLELLISNTNEEEEEENEQEEEKDKQQQQQ